MADQLRIQHRHRLGRVEPIPEPDAASWDAASPAAGYGPWLTRSALPDPFLLAAQSGCRIPYNALTLVTHDEVEAELRARGRASGFRIEHRLRPESADWWGAIIEDYWIDGVASTSGYMLQPFQRAGSQLPPNYDAWPHFRHGTHRGWGARPEYDGGEIATPSAMYGQRIKLEAVRFYGTKNGMQPVGDIHVWGCWGHGNHWTIGDHNGIVQIRDGGGFKLFQDCRFEGFRDYHQAGPGGGHHSGACWQTGSLLEAIEYAMVDNCFFDGGQVSLRGADLGSEGGGWATGVSDPDGYVKNHGWYVFNRPLLGRDYGSGPIASTSPETTLFNPRWYDTREPVGG